MLERFQKGGNNNKSNNNNNNSNSNNRNFFNFNINSSTDSTVNNKYNMNINKDINTNIKSYITQDKGNNYDNNSYNINTNPINSNFNNKSSGLDNTNSYNQTNNNSTNYSSLLVKRRKKESNYFKDRPTYEKESRRMTVEYLKVLNKKVNNISRTLNKNNISKLVLNQDNGENISNLKSMHNSVGNMDLNVDSRANIFTNDNIISNNNFSTNGVLSNICLSPSQNYPDKKSKNKTLDSISKFFVNMKDDSRDKLEIINFLSKPKLMTMNYRNNKYKFIFILCPNKLCYLNGIESYVYKWMDVDTQKFVGGFTLVKIIACFINSKYVSHRF